MCVSSINNCCFDGFVGFSILIGLIIDQNWLELIAVEGVCGHWLHIVWHLVVIWHYFLILAWTRGVLMGLESSSNYLNRRSSIKNFFYFLLAPISLKSSSIISLV